MSLVIPPTHCNVTWTINNATAGLSAKSSISLGMQLATPLTQTLVGIIANYGRDDLLPLWDNSWTMGPTHIVENQGGQLFGWDDTGTEAGTHANDVYTSPAIAHVISKATGLIGREHRGRFYLPGVPENKVDEGGVLDGAHVNTVTTAVRQLQTDLIAMAAVNYLVLFHDDQTPGALGPDPITDLFCRTVVGTMRPRQRR